MKVKIKIQKSKSNGGRYVYHFITLPKILLDNFPKLKRKQFIELETDLMGNVQFKI